MIIKREYWMNLSRIEALIDDLEHHPDRVQLHYTELEKSIAWAAGNPGIDCASHNE